MDHVTLEVRLEDGLLHVDETDNGNIIPRGKRVKITWQLSVPGGSHGSFNPIGDPTNPGFSWIESPTAGVFGQDEITITDTNGSANSKGERDYEYQLWATIEGQQYTTKGKLSGRSLNPKIKNL